MATTLWKAEKQDTATVTAFEPQSSTFFWFLRLCQQPPFLQNSSTSLRLAVENDEQKITENVFSLLWQ